MTGLPETQLARTAEGAFLAYQVVGDGQSDLVLTLNGGWPVDLVWDFAPVAAFLGRLSSFTRLITFDARGFGSSSRVDPYAIPAVQTWMDDIGTVMDAVGSRRATIMSWGENVHAAALFAATYPERVQSLVLVNGYARYVRSDETPWGMPAASLPGYEKVTLEAWGTGAATEWLTPSLVPDAEARRAWARAERLSGAPDAASLVSGAFRWSDVSDVLGVIQAPTLVMSATDARHVRVQHGRHLAEKIAHSRFVELPGADTAPFGDAAAIILEEVEEFVTGIRPGPVLDRVLATVMFTDIVGSTVHAAEMGDRRWRELLDRYDELVGATLERYRGRLVKTTGDGTLATFDGPARAVECARVLLSAVRPLGIELRAGLHTGEVEIRGDDLAGIAVHLAARVADRAGAHELLVTRTVTDLVVGSGLTFADRGAHELKGVPGSWQLYQLEDGQPP